MDIVKYGYNSVEFIREIAHELSEEEKAFLNKHLKNDLTQAKLEKEKYIKKAISYISKSAKPRKAFLEGKSDDEIFIIKIISLYHLCKAVMTYEAIDKIMYTSKSSYRSFASTSVKYFSDINHETICDFLLTHINNT